MVHRPSAESASSYNYARFRSARYDLAAFDGPVVGDPMPDVGLEDLDGQRRSFADYRGQTLVVETASITCPMYVKGIGPMTELARRHGDVAFVVLYVREAHPGERLGPHRGRADKREAAERLAPTLGEKREVLIDDLGGTAHKALGAFPNMVYIAGPDGRVRFRSDWADPSAVAEVLADTASPDLLATSHRPPAKPSPVTAVRTLLTGGWVALFDFVRALPSLLAQHRRADVVADRPETGAEVAVAQSNPT